MHSLTNVPTEKSGHRIVGFARGENIDIRCLEKLPRGDMDPGVNMTSWYIGDHMFKPENQQHLREAVANVIATAIRMGRDAGYAQAKAEIREALGVPAK